MPEEKKEGTYKAHHEPKEPKAHAGKKKELAFDAEFFITLFLVVLVGIFVVSLFLSSGLTKEAEKKITETKEAARPAKLQLTLITNSQCRDCSDIGAIIEIIKKGNTNITEEKNLEFTDAEAKSLMDKYGIQKLPMLIVQGEIERYSHEALVKKEDALVLKEINPPYFDVAKNKAIGKLSIVYLTDKNCGDCVNVTALGNQLRQNKVVVGEEKKYEYDSSSGKALIEKYDISKVPTVVLSEDAGAYPLITQIWNDIGTVEEDGMYVMRNVQPPYRDLTDNEVKGLVILTLLNDSSCTECYDVSVHKLILQNFGLKFKQISIVDAKSAEGQALVKTYNIVNVPSPILSKDADFYLGLKQVWNQVGTIEKDGSYVFRNMEQLGEGVKYKDLGKNQIITVAAQAAS